MTFRRNVAQISAALLALCATAATAAAPTDACSVFPAADVVAALGMPVTSTVARAVGPAQTCTYRAAKPMHALLVTAYRWASTAEATTAFHAIVKQTAAMMPAAAVAGVGDEAENIGGSIYVRAKDRAYVINLIDGSVGDARTQRALALAKKAKLH